MKTAKRGPAIWIGMVCLLSACPLSAQSGASEWSSVAKITKGSCADGAVASVNERPGSMHLKLAFPNGKQYAEFDVAIAADGSGKAQFQGSIGATVMEVPAGKGERPLKTTQVQGICQWLWTPK
jgi:hypothetical protein